MTRKTIADISTDLEAQRRETLDDLFDHAVDNQRKRADEIDADKAYQARAEAKRKTEIKRHIAAGIRDENGDYIMTDEDDDQ